MKKSAIIALMLGTAIAANAEGYQVNTFSAKQEGMGHAGVAHALLLRAECIYLITFGICGDCRAEHERDDG